MTEPKEQAVPVVGVEEAVERLSGFSRALSNRRIAFKAAFSQAYGRDAGPQKSALNRDLRTILQALQGSSACADFSHEGSNDGLETLAWVRDLQAQLKAAYEALKPFALAAENMDGDEPDDLTIWESPEAMSLLFGDLRKAHEIYSRKGGE